jgi:hypothetical protein
MSQFHPSSNFLPSPSIGNNSSFKKRKHIVGKSNDDEKTSNLESETKYTAQNIVVDRSEIFTFFYKPGAEGLAAVLGARLLSAYLGLKSQFVPENSCNDVACLSTPSVKYKNNFVSHIPLIMYFLHNNNCLGSTTQTKHNFAYASTSNEAVNDSSTRRSVSLPGKNKDSATDSTGSTYLNMLKSNLQGLKIEDLVLEFENEVAQINILNILLEMDKIVTNVKIFVKHCAKSKADKDAYVGSILARKLRALNAIIIETWVAKGLENINVTRGKHGQNIVCEITEAVKHYYFFGKKISCIDFQIISFVIHLRLLLGEKIIDGILQHRGNIVWSIYKNMRNNKRVKSIINDFSYTELSMFGGSMSSSDDEENQFKAGLSN